MKIVGTCTAEVAGSSPVSRANNKTPKGVLLFAQRSGVSAHATAGLERLDIVSVSRAETVEPGPSGARSDGDETSAWPSPSLAQHKSPERGFCISKIENSR